MDPVTITALISGAIEMTKFVVSLRQAAQQSGDWTAEHEAQYNLLLVAKRDDPAWTTHTGDGKGI